jgi:hypothetical protein
LKIYFNANNKATKEALIQCGVKNVMLSFRHSYANINTFRNKFESVFVVAGTKTKADNYHSFLRTKKEYYDLATQYDVRYDMDETVKYLEKERKEGIDWTIPVLQKNYLLHLSRIRPEPNSMVCLGEIHGYDETEDQIRKLPRNLKYHGLAKGKFVMNRVFDSIDTSAWISAAMSKKTEVWNANTTYSMFFGEKGKSMKPMLNHALEVYKENLEKVNVTKDGILNNDYYHLLKAPVALLFMPMCKALNCYEENFIN